MEKRIQFYLRRKRVINAAPPPEGYDFQLWKPSLLEIKPSRLPMHPKLVIWWLFHQLGIFQTKDYSILLIVHEKAIAHYSFVFPKWFRFPFMTRGDLQIGDVWTSENHRNRGLASCALCKIVQLHESDAADLWYLTTNENEPSAKVAQKAGFTLHAEGVRTNCLGLSLLGSYQTSNFPSRK